MTADEIVTVQISDCSYSCNIKPSSEKGVHAEVYKLYSEANFVIHTHQENASVISACNLNFIAVISIVLTKEKPLTPPPGPIALSEDLSRASFKKLFNNKPYKLVLLISLISMGIFNTILTLIESILIPRGITSIQAGIVGAVFVVAGIVGAVVLPIISDKIRVRVPMFIIIILLLIPLYLGLTFVNSFILVSIIAGTAGFAIMGVAPILFQYGSEVAYPIQEGTSLGLILLMGQISGALFVYVFEALAGTSGSIVWPMLLIVGMTAIEVPFTLRMKESKVMSNSSQTTIN